MWDPEKTVRYNVPPPPGRGRRDPLPGSHVKPNKGPSPATTSIIGIQGKRHNCLVCCAWVFLLSFAIAVLILIAGAAFLTILRSALPQFRILAFDVPWLRINNQSDTLLTVVFRAQLEVYNKNSDTKLHFSNMMLYAAADNIRLGDAPVTGFVQETNNRTILNVQTTLSNGVVNEDDANELAEDANNGQLVVTTVLGGHVGFRLGALQMTQVPLLVVCRDVKQNDLIFGKHPSECEVQIFKYR